MTSMKSYFAARVTSDELRMKMHELDRHWMLRQIEPNARASFRTFLDIGCADGRFLKGFNFGGVFGVLNQTLASRK
jgi:hypothetical protein